MQIWVPYPDFKASADVLDPTRLNDTGYDVLRVLEVLHETPDAKREWLHHPTVEAWRGHEPQLAQYGLVLREEYMTRRRLDIITSDLEWHLETATSGEFTMEFPSWFGNPDVHLMHQSVLLRKEPSWYETKFPGIPSDIPEFYPKQK